MLKFKFYFYSEMFGMKRGWSGKAGDLKLSQISDTLVVGKPKIFGEGYPKILNINTNIKVVNMAK